MYFNKFKQELNSFLSLDLEEMHSRFHKSIFQEYKLVLQEVDNQEEKAESILTNLRRRTQSYTANKLLKAILFVVKGLPDAIKIKWENIKVEGLPDTTIEMLSKLIPWIVMCLIIISFIFTGAEFATSYTLYLASCVILGTIVYKINNLRLFPFVPWVSVLLTIIVYKKKETLRDAFNELLTKMRTHKAMITFMIGITIVSIIANFVSAEKQLRIIFKGENN